MATRIRIFPYKLGSKSASALSNALSTKCSTGVLKVKPNGQYQPKDSDIIIGWGMRANPLWNQNLAKMVLNKPAAVDKAANKITAFRLLEAKGVSTVPWTLEAGLAVAMLEDGASVIVRTMVSGHGGAGIFVASSAEEWDSLQRDGVIGAARFYTRYIKPNAEYRVHVVGGRVIDCVMKRAMNSSTRDERGITLNKMIRNHNNGWVFARQGTNISEALQKVSVDAVAALGLDFGAVDIIDTDNGPLVLEVNTAPGIEGTTLEKYTEAFASLCGY